MSAQLALTAETDWNAFLESIAKPRSGALHRRTEPRYEVLVGQVLLVYVVDTGMKRLTDSVVVPLMQVSQRGLMVRSPIEFDFNTRLAMELTYLRDAFCLLGRVKHCTNTVGGFKLGIMLEFNPVVSVAP